VSAKFGKLTWSHFVELLTVTDDDERKFYETECIENTWSVRELHRQVDSALYERLALSKNKTEVRKLSKK
jgi:predicted nuclease of restriction endonuclease-like (RecB) superfamily